MVAKNNKARGSAVPKPDKGPEEVILMDAKLLQLLVCPLTKHALTFDKDKCELVSVSARLAYPIRGGIPIMLPSEARALEDNEL